MNDTRAKEELQELLDWYDSYNRPAVGNALKHALQAIADRAALAADYDSEIGVKVSTMEAARRHMHGE